MKPPRPNGLHEAIRSSLINAMGGETPQSVTFTYQAGAKPGKVTIDYYEFLAGLALAEAGFTASTINDPERRNSKAFMATMQARCHGLGRLVKESTILCLKEEDDDPDDFDYFTHA